MDPGLWHREKDGTTTTTTPGAVPTKTARRDFREMGMNEEARPAGEWTDLREPYGGVRRSATPRAKGKESVRSVKGKEAVRPSKQTDADDFSRGYSTTNAANGTALEPLASGALSNDHPKTTSGSAVSTRFAGSESTVTPDSSEPLLTKEGSDDGADETNKTISGTSEKSDSPGQPSTRSSQPKRQSVFLGARKGIAKYLPAKKKEPQY